VQHGLVEAPLGYVSVPNAYRIEDFEQAALAATPSPRNWNEVLEHCRQRFDRLIIADTIEAVLRPEPFSAYVGERVSELLGVLQQFALSRIGPDTARGVGGIEQPAELVAIVGGSVGNREAADEAVPAVDLEMFL
jgi:hypothetical protein